MSCDPLFPLLATALTPVLIAGAAAGGETTVDFDRDVRPILSENCFLCHGHDPSSREAGLRLDTREGALGELGDGRRAIVPGDVAASALAARIRHADPQERMPPPDSGRTLTDEERALLVRWIEEGAQWEEHWAFVPPEHLAPPEVRDPDWARSELDRFVLARLEAEGLTPAVEADRRTLMRRVTLDLTGLPPTPEEVAAFVADESPGAYERVVERLLASPRYGEHMARYWLDVARYGDTHGLHLDNYREMWPYRDWVIAAFNQNLPYDQFVVEQLAGDMLPDATLDQRIATGFNRAHVSTNEGGSIEEEVYVRNVVDRVNTMGTGFLGMTVGCAQCHDHKFDPLPQREYYQLFAFFNNLDGKPMDGNAKAHPPVVKVPRAEQNARLEELAAELAVVEEEIAAELEHVEYVEPPEPEARHAEQVEVVWVDDALPAGAVPEGDGLVWVEAPRELVHSGRLAMKRTSRGNQQHFFTNADQKLRVGAGDVLFAWVHLDPADPPREIMLQFNSLGAGGGWRHRAYWGENRIEWGEDGTGERRHMGALPEAGKWTRLEVPVAQVGLGPGAVVHGMAFTQFDGTAYWDTAGIVSATPQEPEDFVWIDDDVPSGAQLQGDGKTWQWVGGDEHPVKNGLRTLRRSMGGRLNQDFFTGARPLVVQAGDVLFAHAWLDPEDPPSSTQLQFNDGTWEHRARWGEPAHGAGRGGAADFRAGDVPETGRWVRLEVEVEKVGLAPGAMVNGWAFTQVGGTVYWDQAGVRTWGPPDDRYLESQLAWELQVVGDDGLPEEVRAALAVDRAARSSEQARRLRDHYLRYVYGGTRQVFGAHEARVKELRDATAAVEAAIPTTLVMQERLEPRPAFLLRRGEYDLKGEQVERATPVALPAMDPELPRNRLGLARWLVARGHPLTARVAVNRFWQQLFGAGIVLTAEDFGNQGARPSHSELLDWLALAFMDDGWDVKRMMKRLVTSATYRQSSSATPELLAADSENRLLARGPRFRLDAEMLRDQALFVSGLLVEELGGPGVKPPQPGGLWKTVAYVGSNTMTFQKDEGPEKVYRRSLYTFWKRTSPPPQMSTFDAPSREECRVRRERTNTPLQALLLLNDPQYVEAARHLAARAVREAGATSGERAGYAHLLCTARPPSDEDLADLVALYRAQLADYVADPEAARRLVSVGESPPDPSLDPAELAAWTVIASLLLNLDEVVTK